MIKDTSAQDIQVAKPGANKAKWLKIGAAGAVLLGGLWFAAPGMSSFYGSDMTVSEQDLRTAVVTRGDLLRDLSVQGRVVAAVSPTLYAPSAGRATLHIQAGDTVTKGQLLAEIESPELQSRYDQELSTEQELQLEVGRQEIQTKATLLDNRQRTELAEVDLEVAESDNNRAEVSIKSSLISQEQYEQEVVKLKKAKLQHRHAEQNEQLQKEQLEFELAAKKQQLQRQQLVVAELKRQIEQLHLRSPLDGVIGAVNINNKDAVAANQGLISVVDLTAFEVEVSIPQNYADDLGPGLLAELNLNGQNHPGKLTAISPEVINGQVAGRVKFEGDMPQGLRQNQRISARVMIESRQNVLKVQRGAFVETGGGRVAYRVSDKNAQRIAVRLGAYSINEIEVLDGLKEGDRIITSSLSDFDDKNQLFIAQ